MYTWKQHDMVIGRIKAGDRIGTTKSWCTGWQNARKVKHLLELSFPAPIDSFVLEE